ncbi:hypothetical protein WN093_03065 [Gammaproteobacteria bacterium AS21]
MQYRTPSQQSYVRTDFTLKYLSLEQALHKSAFFKVMGSQSPVFIRSWIDYTANNGVLVLPWVGGNLEQIQLAYFSKNELGDVKPAEFSEFIDQLASPVVIAVDFLAVDSVAFVALIKHVKKYNEAREAAQNNVESVKAIAQSNHLQRLSVVIYIEDESALNSAHQSALADFKASLLVGQAATKIVKGTDRGNAKKIIALPVIIGACVVLWLNQASIASVFAPKAVSQPQSDESKTRASVLSDTASAALASTRAKPEHAPALLVINDEGISAKTEAVKSSLNDTDPVAIAGDKDLNSSLLSSVTSTVEVTENTQLSKQMSEENVMPTPPVIDSSDLVGVESTDQPSVEALQSLELADEAVVASEQQGSADTGMSDEHNITALVDAWINGWQQQDFTVYSESYSSNYSARRGMSHQKWLEWRKARIEKPKWIKLSRSELDIVLDKNNSASFSVAFTLDYSSPNYKDKTLKKLSVNNIDGDFKIVAEENLKVTRVK